MALCLATVGIFACKARQNDTGAKALVRSANLPEGAALDVNDVTFLFPKRGPGQFYPDIRGRDIWPAAAFNDLIAFTQAADGVPVADRALDPAKTGRIRYGQFLLDQGFLAEMAGVKTRQAPAPQDSARTRAAIEVNAAIASGKTKCDDLPDGRKLCVDLAAKISFSGHRRAITELDNWRVVGMRVDLCAGANNATTEQCEIEFRLTAQPFGDCPPAAPKQAEPACSTSAATNMFDVSAHLLYRLGFLDVKTGLISGAPAGVTFTLQEIIRDLQLIKEAGGGVTDGMPLGLHPGLKREARGDERKVGDEVLRVINKYTQRGAGMTYAASMQLADAGAPGMWVFFHGPVDAGRWAPGAITGSETTWSIRTASVKGARGRVFPPTDVHSDRVSINQIFKYDRNQPLPLQPSAQEEIGAQDLPAFFDNPGRYGDVGLKVGNLVASSVRNADCIGCHSTTVRAFEWRLKTFDPTPGAQRALVPSLYQPPVGTTAYLDPEVVPRNAYSMRNLGYFSAPPAGSPEAASVEAPAVMTRVVHESAELVNLINTRFIKKPNPGLRCAGGGSESEDPEVALQASTSDDVFADANQRKIRRGQNVHAMIFDCVLFEAYKPGGSFKACADRCQK